MDRSGEKTPDDLFAASVAAFIGAEAYAGEFKLVSDRSRSRHLDREHDLSGKDAYSYLRFPRTTFSLHMYFTPHEKFETPAPL